MTPIGAQAGTGSVWLRTLLLAPLVWWSLTLITGASSHCFIDLVNLAFHEAGHLVFSFAGSTLHFLGGTLGQLLVPLLLALNFLFRERQPFAAAVCAWWTGENFINISVYMADARTLALPLVGGGDHDWNELFHRFGLLGESAVQTVSMATHALGAAVMIVSLAWCATFVLPAAARHRLRGNLASRWPWTEALLEP